VMNRWLLCGNSSLSCPSTLFHKFPAAIGFHLLLSGSQVKLCPVCNWDLSIYSLSPEGLREEQESKIYWSVEVWKELKLLRQERELIASEYALKEQWIDRLLKVFRDLAVEIEDECSKKLDSLNDVNNELSQKLNRLNREIRFLQKKLNRIENKIEEDGQVREAKYRRFESYLTDYSSETCKEENTYHISLPLKVKEALGKHTKKGSRGTDGQTYWLRKAVIYYALIEEKGWL
ncbi:hypothetical protein H6F79_02095, partial [Trichocoleus sp. FACHB-69]|uniref:hypothetical protein n=1 Tax=Trichocoleus sp. FACHB-69 TaxID=2692874 RepID=UPI0018EFC827